MPGADAPQEKRHAVTCAVFYQVQAGSTAAVATVASPSSSVLATVDEEDQSFEVRQCVAALREGKRCDILRTGPEAALQVCKQ